MNVHYDDNGDRITKAAIRKWLKRVREDVADAERALRDGDWETAWLAMQDASCAAGEAEIRCEVVAND